MHGPGLTILADSNDLFLDGDPVDHSVLFTYLTGRPNTRYLTPSGAFGAPDLVNLCVRTDAQISASVERSAHAQPPQSGPCPGQPERMSR